jgi:hypothetical protein
MKSILATKMNGSDLTFTWNLVKNCAIEEVELIEKGREIYITDDNKNQFIEKV